MKPTKILSGKKTKTSEQLQKPGIPETTAATGNFVSYNLDETIAVIKKEFGETSDLTVNLARQFGEKTVLRYAIIYIDNLVDKDTINSLTNELAALNITPSVSVDPFNWFELIRNKLSGFRKVNESFDFTVLCNDLLAGNTVFLVDGVSGFFSINAFAAEGRPVAESTTQTVIRGPKEGFSEKISVNLALVRKRIRNKALRVEDLNLGTITQTKVSLMYLDGIAKPEIVAELKRRLSQVKIDAILDSQYIEELIKDDRHSIFPTFLNLEKPDALAAAILEGRVAVFVDGTAYVLTAPALFIEFLQASEDYYHHFIVGSILRFLRFIAFLVTVFTPALYVALVTFHQEMIPTSLLISIAAQREGVPFPSLIEALLMGGLFEIITEAGVRMPRAVGPAITFVGALVLGQAAVEAGIFSAVIVIITSITAIANFAITNYSFTNPIKILRFTEDLNIFSPQLQFL